MNCRIADITKGSESVRISLVDDLGTEEVPKFNYIPRNMIHQDAYLDFSLARISDKDCCETCKGDCLSADIPCACACETGGEYAYTRDGLLKEEFLDTCLKMRKEPDTFKKKFCIECPLEADGRCDGHLIQKFIKECWTKCGCDMLCGNRIVQRGIKCLLQVFSTHEGKGWGVRTLQDLPKGTFVFEYVGEILTNTELDKRNSCYGTERHTYPVTLDADWVSERILIDKEALCLDATFFGNVARFVNHRCEDANLIVIPVEIETPDRHYYHVAFFTTRDVKAMDELTWDYLIDFSDDSHPVKAFRCFCGSELCRDKTTKSNLFIGDRVGMRKARTMQKAVKKQEQRRERDLGDSGVEDSTPVHNNELVPGQPSWDITSSDSESEISEEEEEEEDEEEEYSNAGVQGRPVEGVSSKKPSFQHGHKSYLEKNGTALSNDPVQRGKKRKRLFWTEEEVKMLTVGVEKFHGNKNIPWCKILEHGGSAFQEGRRPSELKDKWKNMKKMSV